MLSVDEKLKRMKKKSEQLEKEIRNKTDEKKQLDIQIELLSYKNLKNELSSHNMTADDYVLYARLVKKMEDNSVSFDDIDSMIDSLSEHKFDENEENNDDEKKIF